MPTKIKIARSREEAEREYENKYDRVLKAPPVGVMGREDEGAVVMVDEHGLIVPDTRDVKCGCGRKLKVYLAQKFPPIWAGRCPRCRGTHYRGERATIEKMTPQQQRLWLRKAKETRRHRIYKE